MRHYLRGEPSLPPDSRVLRIVSVMTEDFKAFSTLQYKNNERKAWSENTNKEYTLP